MKRFFALVLAALVFVMAAPAPADAQVRLGRYKSGFSYLGGGVTCTVNDATALAYIAAMSSAPDCTRQTLIDNWVACQKAGTNPWATYILAYLLAAHDQQAGRLNIVNPALYTITNTGMTFTTDRGFAGDGVSAFGDTGFADNTAAVTWTRDSAAYQAYSNVTGASFQVGASGVTTTRVTRTNTAITARLHGAGGDVTGVVSGSGLTSVVRSSSTQLDAYNNAVSVGTQPASTSTAPGAATILLFKSNSVTFGTGRMALFRLGGAMSAGQVATSYACDLTYLTAIGAN